MFEVLDVAVSAALATNGTIAVNYPANRTRGDFQILGPGHRCFARGLMADLVYPAQFTLTFNTANITFTYKGTTTIPAGTNLKLSLELLGANDDQARRLAVKNRRSGTTNVVRCNLGSPSATNAAGLAASQSVNAAAAAVLLTPTLDVPRNVVAAWTTTATLTVTGRDEYGVLMTEQVVAATAFTGKKAFKTITSMVITGAAVTLFTAGWGNVLGMPIYYEGAGAVLADYQDSALAAAGTNVAGVANTPSTSATGDVRGTYVPASAPDGTKQYSVTITVDDANYLGQAQA